MRSRELEAVANARRGVIGAWGGKRALQCGVQGWQVGGQEVRLDVLSGPQLQDGPMLGAHLLADQPAIGE